MLAVRGLSSANGVNTGANPGVETLAVVLESSNRFSSHPSRGANDQLRRRSVAWRRAPGNVPEDCQRVLVCHRSRSSATGAGRGKNRVPATLDQVR